MDLPERTPADWAAWDAWRLAAFTDWTEDEGRCSCKAEGIEWSGDFYQLEPGMRLRNTAMGITLRISWSGRPGYRQGPHMVFLSDSGVQVYGTTEGVGKLLCDLGEVMRAHLKKSAEQADAFCGALVLDALRVSLRTQT